MNLNFAALAHDAFRDHDALWYESRRIPITREYLAALDEWASIRGTAGASAADRMLFERQRREFRDPHAVEVIRRVRVDEVREEADAAER